MTIPTLLLSYGLLSVAVVLATIAVLPVIRRLLDKLRNKRREKLVSRVLDQRIQFTAYGPPAIKPDQWHPLLVFAHESSKSAALAHRDQDQIAEVRRQAESILGAARASQYEKQTFSSTLPLHKGVTLTYIPDVIGIEFDPPQRTFDWLGTLHREEFLLRAAPDNHAPSASGRLTVLLGSTIVADISLTIRIQPVSDDVPEAPVVSTASAYRKIFASYSRRDAAVVEDFERLALGMGDKYLRDVTDIRAGEVWSERLRELIAEADVFQLFWSWNSLNSSVVEEEWRYALSLGRRNFVRPVYWERPRPELPERGLPPPELDRLNFQPIAVPGPRPMPAPSRSRPSKTIAAMTSAAALLLCVGLYQLSSTPPPATGVNPPPPEAAPSGSPTGPFVPTETSGITNPGFELGNVGWGAGADIIKTEFVQRAHLGRGFALLGGLGERGSVEIGQTIRVPNSPSASLEFFLRIATVEKSKQPVDTLRVLVAAGTQSTTLAEYSNLDAAEPYLRKRLSLAQFRGQVVMLRIVSDESSEDSTSFYLDDFSLSPESQ